MITRRQLSWFVLPAASLLSLLVIAVVTLQAKDLTAQAVPPAPTAAGSSLEQRVSQRKTERGIVLDERATKKLETSCVSSQTKFRSIQSGILELDKKRQGTYQHIEGKVWVVIGRLKVGDRDTFNLETAQSDYIKKSAAFTETFDELLQAIDDILVINCQADPVGFMSYVETIRLYYADLAAKSTDINKHLVDSVRPLISQHAEEL